MSFNPIKQNKNRVQVHRTRVIQHRTRCCMVARDTLGQEEKPHAMHLSYTWYLRQKKKTKEVLAVRRKIILIIPSRGYLRSCREKGEHGRGDGAGGVRGLRAATRCGAKNVWRRSANVTTSNLPATIVRQVMTAVEAEMDEEEELGVEWP